MKFESKDVTPDDLWNTADKLVKALAKVKEMAKGMDVGKPWPWE